MCSGPTAIVPLTQRRPYNNWREVRISGRGGLDDLEIARRIEVNFVTCWAMQHEGAAQIAVTFAWLELNWRTVCVNNIRSASLLNDKLPAVGLGAFHLVTIAHS
jgi:hypothetical protein